jgi:ankyrin repeat protein
VRHGGNIEALSTFGRRPLHLAAIKGCLTIAEKLIELKAELNCVDRDGNTPLHYACERGCADMIELLLVHKARSDIMNAKKLYAYDSTPDPQIREIFVRYNAVNSNPNTYNGAAAYQGAYLGRSKEDFIYKLQMGKRM